MSVPQLGFTRRLSGGMDNPRSLDGVKGLVYWSLGHIWYAMILSLMPPNSGIVYQMYKFLGVSVIACMIVTFAKLKAPLRLVFPVYMLMVLQVWFFFCDLHASYTLGRFSIFGTPDFLLLFYVFYFVQASVIAYVAPEYRKTFMRFMMWTIVISGIVAVLQFVKFGPALALGYIYNTAHSIEEWDTRGGIRAFGLTGWPESMALLCIGGFAMVAGRMFERKLKAWEIAYAGFFLFVGVIAQSRTMYFGILACVIIFVWMLAKRDKATALLFVFLGAILLTVVGVIAYEQLSYATNTNPFDSEELRFRLQVGWPQAYHIFEYRPWTGIGPDTNLVFINETTIPDFWVGGATLDNGYLMLISWGGLPALAIFVTALFAGIRGMFRTTKIKGIDPDRRLVAFFCLMMLLGLTNDMATAVGFVSQPWINMLIMTAAGLAMPSRTEAVGEITRPYVL